MAKTPTPETVALARRLYAEGAPIESIRARTGLTLNRLYRCLGGAYPDLSGTPPEPMPRRRDGGPVRERIGNRAALVARMWRAAERQVDAIEKRLASDGLQIGEDESGARTLAIVARTLRELSAVDATAAKEHGKQTPKPNDDDTGPRDIDELRRALARKLEAFVAGATNSVPRDAE